MFTLQKWNGTAYVDVTATYINLAGKTVTETDANYPMTAAPYGKYRASLTLSDTAGNTTAGVIDFYIDSPSFTVSSNASNLGGLSANTLSIGGTEITVTVKTLGAGFDLKHSKVGTMTSV